MSILIIKRSEPVFVPASSVRELAARRWREKKMRSDRV
jgi:hypothetical protein